MDLQWQRVKGDHLLVALTVYDADIDRVLKNLSVASEQRLPATGGRVYVSLNGYQVGRGGEINALQITEPHIDLLIPSSFTKRDFNLVDGHHYSVRSSAGRFIDVSIGVHRG